MARKKAPKLPVPLTEEQPRWKLQRWHYHFANWLIQEPTAPTIREQEATATRLANEGRPKEAAPVKVTYRQIQRFKARPDFQEYVERVSAGGLEAARQLFLTDLPLYAELFKWGAERAKAKDDVRGLASYVVPAADRILPKRPDVLAVGAPVQIMISARQAAGLHAPEAEVWAEEIESAPRAALRAPQLDPQRYREERRRGS